MTAAAKSIYYFAFYLFIMGIGLLFTPNMVLKIINIPETQEVWIRVVGFLALILGVYYIVSAKNNYTEFIKITVPTRIFAFICFAVFALTKLGHPMLIGVGAVDLIGAVWTYNIIKKQ